MNQQSHAMTLVQLRHFLSVAETGSFTRSASVLAITQPALSRSIRALEENFRQPLFERVHGRNELTPFGRDALKRVQQLVCDSEDLVTSARTWGGTTLRVGLGPAPGALLAVTLMERMAHPDATVRIDILRGDTARLMRALRDRTLDAVVVEFRGVMSSADLRIEPLVDLRGGFLCRPGHPLAQQLCTLSFEDIRPFPIASTSLGQEVARELVDAHGPEAHPDRCVRLRCSEISYLVELAKRTDVVLLAVRAVAPELICLPVSPVQGVARFGLVTLADLAEVPGLPLLREVIAERMSESA